MSGGQLTILAAVIGMALGSFLNVCIARWPAGRSVVRPRSECWNCRAPLRWFEIVPVLGYVIARGRCARCRTGIGAQYPLVEIATAVIWAGMAARWGLHPEALRGAVFLTILLAIAVSDARTYIIPDQFSLGGAVIGLALAPLAGGPELGSAVLGAALGFAFLWAVATVGRIVLGKDAMGGGDVKMMAMVGAFVGPPGVLVTLFGGALLGALVFAPVSLRSGRLVPFGVFLALGAGVAYTWGDAIAAWYAGTILGLE